MNFEIDLENLTEEAIIEAYMFGLRHHLGHRFVRDRQACGVLRECLLREYSMTGFDMKGVSSPFADCKVSKDANVAEYELPQLDAYQYFLTWQDYGSLPDEDMDRYAIACVYPVVRPDWDGQGGFYALAVAYWNSKQVKKIEPMSDWSSRDVQWVEQKKSDIYTQGLAKHQDWINNPSPYFRVVWARYMVEVWKKRQMLNIPLTPWQQSFVDAGGWPQADDQRAEEAEKNGNGSNSNSVFDRDFDHGDNLDAEISESPPRKSEEIIEKKLMDHCIFYRDKYTKAENIEHHLRWNAAIRMIKHSEFDEAKKYAKQWADKGWKPWQELINMIDEE